MRIVELTLESKSDTLQAHGAVFASPVSLHPTPVLAPLLVRKTHPEELKLLPGKYQFRFDLAYGEGEFVLYAKYSDGSLVDKIECDTAKYGFNDLVLHFTITEKQI